MNQIVILLWSTNQFYLFRYAGSVDWTKCVEIETNRGQSWKILISKHAILMEKNLPWKISTVFILHLYAFSDCGSTFWCKHLWNHSTPSGFDKTRSDSFQEVLIKNRLCRHTFLTPIKILFEFAENLSHWYNTVRTLWIHCF